MCSPFPLAPTSTHVEWLNKNSSCVNVSPFFFCIDVNPCCSNWSLDWRACFSRQLEQLTISRTYCIFWIQFWEVYFQFIVILNKSTLDVPKERPNLQTRSTCFELCLTFYRRAWKLYTVQFQRYICIFINQQAWQVAIGNSTVTENPTTAQQPKSRLARPSTVIQHPRVLNRETNIWLLKQIRVDTIAAPLFADMIGWFNKSEANPKKKSDIIIKWLVYLSVAESGQMSNKHTSKHLKACLGTALVTVLDRMGSPWHSISHGFGSEGAPLALR